MAEHEVPVEPLNTTFARTMQIVTRIGIIVMVLSGGLYFLGVSSFVDMRVAIAHWDEPVGMFWQDVEGTKVSGYTWFVSHCNDMDCISMLGICVLALAPLCSLISALRKSTTQKVYVLFFLILILEFLFAIIRPLIMAGGGG